jgi:PEP-CTERM motif-containing protein
VDFYGLAFSTSSGVTYNLYYYDDSYVVSNSITDPLGAHPGKFDSPVTLAVEVVPVPEPSTWALMLAGV